MKTIVRAITITILFLLVRPVTATAPPPHRTWLLYVTRQDPCAEKRKPQPYAGQAADAVLQPADLPAHDLGSSGGALSSQLRGMGAADAHKAMYWAKDRATSPLTVYNIVVVFWDEDGARGYMRYLMAKCLAMDGEPVPLPPLADEANACRKAGGQSDIYTVNQRHGNVVTGTGTDGTLATALEVAALAQARVECVCEEEEGK